MAIRIRRIADFGLVALCAAEVDACPGDLYLDDEMHHALSAKFALDYRSETVTTEYPEEWAMMESQKKRDATAELAKWLKEDS